MTRAIKFQNDRFRKNRGGYSRWLLLSCEKCKNPVMIYQKDGSGMLKRIYLDRIVLPKSLTVRRKSLVCKKCGRILGVSGIYEKEKRLVYRLFAGAISKKIIKEGEFTDIQ